MLDTTNGTPPRVIALCGGMVVVFGMERMTFEILRVLRESGAEIHCLLNDWENERIRPLVDELGASWSEGFYGYPLRRTVNPLKLLNYAWNVARTSLGLMREARRFRATHIFVPEFTTALRNAPALLLARARGVPVILTLPTVPERTRFYRSLWRFVISPLATTMVAHSEFTRARSEEVGVPRSKLVVIKNAIPRRSLTPAIDEKALSLARSCRTLLCVGQIAPFKGTHLAVSATLDLLERGEDLQLIVAGMEPEWPPDRVLYFQSMREEVVARAGTDRVHFVGNVSDVLELMESSYLLLAPIPKEEGFGLVVLEAKSSGLPVVAFPCGALSELVAHRKTGYLCSRLDREGLIEGIDYFLSNPEARERASGESRRAYRDPENDCSPEAFARGWRSLFSI